MYSYRIIHIVNLKEFLGTLFRNTEKSQENPIILPRFEKSIPGYKSRCQRYAKLFHYLWFSCQLIEILLVIIKYKFITFRAVNISCHIIKYKVLYKSVLQSNFRLHLVHLNMYAISSHVSPKHCRNITTFLKVKALYQLSSSWKEFMHYKVQWYESFFIETRIFWMFSDCCTAETSVNFPSFISEIAGQKYFTVLLKWPALFLSGVLHKMMVISHTHTYTHTHTHTQAHINTHK